MASLPNIPHLSPNQTKFFLDQGYTTGLIKSLLKLKSSNFQRCWILDNGSNMAVKDSHRLLIRQQNIDKVDGVRRWTELMDCVGTQLWTSTNLNVSMRFALLNQCPVAPQYFSLGENKVENPREEIQKIGNIMKSIQPNGPTNLTKQLTVIHKYVSSITPQLLSANQKIDLVIATQGLPTNDFGESNAQITHDFVSVLKSFLSLSVSITIRLCTDDESVFDFYNHHIDIGEIDVIDDIFGESLEVYLKNPWLTYGLSLHHARESGIRMDEIDERLLTLDELYQFCFILFDVQNLPHPKTNWEGFLNALTLHMQKEKQQWNPVTGKFSPWIDVAKLKILYAKEIPTMYSQQPQYVRPQNMQPPPPQGPTMTSPPPVQTHPSPSPQQGPQPTSDESIKKMLLMSWALQAPSYQSLRQLPELLGSVQNVLPPAFGVGEHKYFQKWKVLSDHALQSGGNAVVKRAHRKAKFLLHPDKLPKDLTERQLFVCKLIWDILADAWEIYTKD